MPNEDFLEYFIRLFENKSHYNINCVEIANLLNKYSNVPKTESAYRKEYAAFNRGRNYERSKNPSGVATRILALSDFHIPFQLPIETFSKYRGNTDVLILNGDIQDCQSVSKFPKSYRVPFVEELVETRKYIINLVEYIKPSKVYITEGNHEKRLFRYLTDKLNDDLLNIMPHSPLDLIINDGFKNINKKESVELWYPPVKNVLTDTEIIYNRDWHCKVGKTIFAHPLAYSSGMLKTAEKAVNYFLRVDRDFDCLVMAHTHKLGSYIQGNITMYEQGCCCDIKALDYADGRLTLPQQSGYLYLCQDKDGNVLSKSSELIRI